MLKSGTNHCLVAAYARRPKRKKDIKTFAQNRKGLYEIKGDTIELQQKVA